MDNPFGFDAVPDFVKYRQDIEEKHGRGNVYMRAGRTVVAIQDGQPRYRKFANAADAVAFLKFIGQGELIEDTLILGKRREK